MKLLSFYPKGNSWSNLSRILIIGACVALLLAILVPTALIPQTISAASTTVNSGQSIQSAINSASAGDTIYIMPGTYNGSLTISKSSITLAKAPGSTGEVIINGNRAESVISVQNAANVVLNGLSITNGTTNGIYFSGSGCTGDQVLNCKITEWGLASTTNNSQICGGITMDGGSKLTVQGSYFQRGNYGGCSDSAYNAGTMNWYGIIVMHSSGGHQVIGNTIWGCSPSGVPNLCDSISNDDWVEPNSSWNNSLISQNAFYGVWDDVIQVDGNINNLTIEKNYIDGMGNKTGFARALISINPQIQGPLYIKNNILKNNGSSYCVIKAGAFTASCNGAKYIDSNIIWNSRAGMGVFANGNSSSSNWYITNNKISTSGTVYGVSGIVSNSANTISTFAEPTINDWQYNPGSNPAPTTTPPATTVSPTPTVTTPPTATSSVFGLSSGNTYWSDSGSVLNSMRFQNTAGNGTLTKLELLYSTSAPVGKVRLGVYADNSGKPGARLLDAGEVDVASGWVGIDNLNLQVTANDYYWLSFNQQNSNAVTFLSSGANTSNIYHYWANSTAYGPLPSIFNLTGAGNNMGPYVMQATVKTSTSSTTIVKSFGLSNGNSVWDQSAGILDAMRFYNVAGKGTLTRLNLLVKDTSPNSMVRLGVYADNSGKPGSLLLDAGETTVLNGWVSISNLKLPVAANTYYWLAFTLKSGNTVVYQSGQATNSHYWVSDPYGRLPGVFPTAGNYANNSPYVMNAGVSMY